MKKISLKILSLGIAVVCLGFAHFPVLKNTTKLFSEIELIDFVINPNFEDNDVVDESPILSNWKINSTYKDIATWGVNNSEGIDNSLALKINYIPTSADKNLTIYNDFTEFDAIYGDESEVTFSIKIKTNFSRELKITGKVNIVDDFHETEKFDVPRTKTEPINTTNDVWQTVTFTPKIKSGDHFNKIRLILTINDAIDGDVIHIDGITSTLKAVPATIIPTTQDGDWHTATTWGGTIPSSEQLILVNHKLTSTADILCKNLIVFSTGSLTLEGTSTAFPSIIPDAKVYGTVNYKRHVNQVASSDVRGNDLISAPVTSDKQTFDAFATVNTNILANPSNTTEKLFGAFDNNDNKYLTYDIAISEEAEIKLESGVGYRAGSTDNSTFTFTGTVNTGTVYTPIKIGTRSHWNLIGNPYPSYLKVKDFLNAQNLAVMDPTAVGIYGYNNTDTDGIWTIYNLNTIDAATLIAPGQGFYVAAESDAKIKFLSAMRSIGNGDDFIIGKSTNQNLNLKLQITNGTKLYKTDFYFNDNSTLGLDPGYDAAVFGRSAPEFAIYSHLIDDNTGRDMAIQSLSPKSSTNAIVPLGINTKAGTEITVSIASSTLPEDVFVYLEDAVTSEMTLLNESDYTFIANEDLTSTGRFNVSFKTSKVLAIEDELQQENSLQLYTTPLNRLFINGQLKETTILNLFDIQGRKVMTHRIEANNNSTQIDLSQFNRGIYIVQIKNNLVSKTKKVIIR